MNGMMLLIPESTKLKSKHILSFHHLHSKPWTIYLLLGGVKKSILHISEKATLQNELGNQEHSGDIHENWCFICVLAYTVNNTAACNMGACLTNTCHTCAVCI